METADVVVCPDCNKVIAPRGEVDEKRRCHCAEEQKEAADAGVAPPRPVKSCYVCGTPLEGKKRLKDKLGRYWCKPCADADERAKQRQEELRCPDCSRVFPDHKLVYFQADRVCQSCFKEREKQLERKIAKASAEKVHKEHEWGKLAIWGIVAAGLIVTGAIIQWLR